MRSASVPGVEVRPCGAAPVRLTPSRLWRCRLADRVPDEARPVSELAQSALLLALISPLLLGLTALVALPVAVAGLIEVRRSGGQLGGTGHALAAMVICVVVLVAVISAALYMVANPLPWVCTECVP